MPLDVDNAMQAILDSRAMRYATCWKITRRDGTILRFTDHDHPLTWTPSDEASSVTFDPASGIDATARQNQSQLSASNLQSKGIISDDRITVADLQQGRYRGAEVVEYLVDWRYPWLGNELMRNRYWIQETKYSGEVWEAQMEGPAKWLEGIIGTVFSRPCHYDFGDSRCQFNLATVTVSGVAVDSVTDRENFAADPADLTDPNHDNDDYFDLGLITWLTGNNVGFVSEIRTYTASGRQFSLQLPTPAEIQVGDTFDVYPGCAKTTNACQGYSNLINFGGSASIPGKDEATRVYYV